MESTTDDLHDLNINAAAADEEDDEDEAQVRLAFLRDPNDVQEDELRRHRLLFPHKAGGVPAWLDPVNLPAGEARLCGFCGDPLRFALQAYAPLPPAEGEDEDADAAYHRSLFVFMCPAMACLRLDQRQQQLPMSRRRSVRVFRCQLPRDNAFYDLHAGKGEATPPPLCGWCKTWRAEMECTGCAARLFCSDKHLQRHMRSCHGNGGVDDGEAPSASVWPEYVMYPEDEEQSDEEDDALRDAESSSTAAQQEQSKVEDAAAEDEAAAVDELMDDFEADEDNARWAAFQAIVLPKQDQVLRYGGARPLWAVATGTLAAGAGAPPCPRCGGARRFEMQLMPQLLYYFHVEARDPDPVDWATVVVYTCARSCGGGGYVEEFAWVQRLPWRELNPASIGEWWMDG